MKKVYLIAAVLAIGIILSGCQGTTNYGTTDNADITTEDESEPTNVPPVPPEPTQPE